jgi:hypothetical protein
MIDIIYCRSIVGVVQSMNIFHFLNKSVYILHERNVRIISLYSNLDY